MQSYLLAELGVAVALLADTEGKQGYESGEQKMPHQLI